MTIGFGIIGSGYMGRTYAACLTRHVPDGRLTAITGGSRAPALAADYQLEQYAGRTLSPAETKRAIERWQQLRGLARQRPGRKDKP